MDYSDYIIYVDESGDHGLSSINEQYPVFVLSFCLFEIEEYTKYIVPRIQQLKFKYFGHDQIIFHEYDIRKQNDDFASFRKNPELRHQFLEDINSLVTESRFSIFSVLIDKISLKSKYSSPFSPYFIAMQFGIERIYNYLVDLGQKDKRVFFIFEKRGKREDRDVELEFRRIVSGQSNLGTAFNKFPLMDLNIILVDKRSNSSGLQLADLTARPLGIKFLHPEQPNRAFDIIKEKLIELKKFP